MEGADMKTSRTGRFFSFLLSLVMVLGIIAVGTDRVAAATDPSTGLVYTITPLGTATITGFTAPAGFGGILTIPATLGGRPVTIIDNRAFYYCSGLTGVTISDSVTTIGTNAFADCPVLTSIWIGAGVNSIGTGAFAGCTALTQILVDTNNLTYLSQDGVLFNKAKTSLIQCPGGKTGIYTIPDGVTSIGDLAFENCSKLTGVTIPGSVISIGDWGLAYCSGLTGVTIPGSVTGIGERAFYCDWRLAGISIPAGLVSIGSNAFAACYGLTQILVDANNTAYASQEGVLFNYAKTSLIQCPAGKTGSYSIPGGVTGIGNLAFGECTGLTGIVIPNSVTSMDDLAFYACSALTSVSIPGSVTSIGQNVFYGCANLTDAFFFGNAPAIGTDVFTNCAVGFKVDYLSTCYGYTDPWNGYAAVPFAVGITYRTHVQDVGWQDCVSDGAVSGTSGQSKRLEAICINLVNLSGSIEYKTHVQDIGWMDWVADGALSGTSGQSKRLEAIQIRLTGQAAELYDVYYRVHAQEFGWLDWAKNGASAGTAGYSYRLEAIQIELVPKGAAAPGSESRPYVDLYSPTGVRYQTHVQDIGWQDYVANGAVSGTSGQSKRLEAIRIMLGNIAGGIEYKTHVQDIGWMDWVADGALSGTSGQSKRLEAIQIRLTGAAASLYDVYYCVHAQNTGWLDWAKNGESAGTAGFSYRLEAIKVVLVLKGGAAPGPTTRPFVQG